MTLTGLATRMTGDECSRYLTLDNHGPPTHMTHPSTLHLTAVCAVLKSTAHDIQYSYQAV